MTYSRSRIDAHQNGDCDNATCPLCELEEADLPECEPCGLRSEDVETCDHGVTACPDDFDEGACALCSRERGEDIADDLATERALDEWRG